MIARHAQALVRRTAAPACSAAPTSVLVREDVVVAASSSRPHMRGPEVPGAVRRAARGGANLECRVKAHPASGLLLIVMLHPRPQAIVPSAGNPRPPAQWFPKDDLRKSVNRALAVAGSVRD